MTHPLTRRIRDPVHGLIRFDGDNEIDCIAWRLIDTPAFQRLRRIKQLGFSDYVFPGATHSRFSHSIGVYHVARDLLRIIRREHQGVDERREAVSVLAALLHDVGHGPFSHTFENVQKSRGAKKKHEIWSSDIILSNDGGIREVLDSFTKCPGIAGEIAELLTSEDPTDIYHAVVSSSFDADRLDYLRRDRLMSGSGAGSIDFDWLLDNIRVADLDLSADDDSKDVDPVATFALGPKAIQPAEAFLVARYHLYEQVYLHKTTRGFEIALQECLKAVAEIVALGKWNAELGLSDGNPLVLFLLESEPTVAHYLALDDTVIWSVLESVARVNGGRAGLFARMIMSRTPMKCLDFESLRSSHGLDPLMAHARIKSFAKSHLGDTIFKDAPQLNCYGRVGEDEVKLHKRITVDVGGQNYREIVEISDTIKTLAKPRSLTRYYFLDGGQREAAIEAIRHK